MAARQGLPSSESSPGANTLVRNMPLCFCAVQRGSRHAGTSVGGEGGMCERPGACSRAPNFELSGKVLIIKNLKCARKTLNMKVVKQDVGHVFMLEEF